MKAIMTVTGLDHTGIIAAVATALAEEKVNIVNVSQTLMDEYFTMIMHVTFDETQRGIEEIQKRMEQVEREQGLIIKLQNDALFRAMHRL